MSANTEVKEYDVPAHIITLFNEAFESGLSHCKLLVSEGTLSEQEIWRVLVDTFIHNKKNLEYIDSRIFNSSKKIYYH